MIPRLALYGIAGAALLAAVLMAWHKVAGWRQDSLRLPVVVAERDAAVAGRKRVEADLIQQTQQNERLERETNVALQRAGASARELAGLLLDYQASLRRSQRAAAAAAGDLDAARRESSDRQAVEDAVAEHFGAASRDAARLTGLQTYVQALPARCVP